MARSSRTKDERTRTFTGCRTCRRRHAKCDEAQPECGICVRLGLTCGGYAPRLFWMTDEPAMPADQRQPCRISEYRFQLFSGGSDHVDVELVADLIESERRDMSNELSRTLGSGKTLDRLLIDIDSACEGHSGREFPDLTRGPFGVFRPQSALGANPSPCSSPEAVVDSTEPICPEPDDAWVEEIPRPDWTNQVDEAGHDFFGDTLDSSGAAIPSQETAVFNESSLPIDPSLAAFMPDVSANCETLPVFNWGFESPGLQNIPADNVPEQGTSHSAGDGHQRAALIPSPRSLTPSPSGFNIPEHAKILLRHYKEYLERTAGSIQAKRKSPWQVIFLPCALETFSELALWNKTSHTRLTILSTLFAHSAFLLHKSHKLTPPDGSGSWLEIGTHHLKQAQGHLQGALQSELAGPEKAKYKELLMAVLALAVTSVGPPLSYSIHLPFPHMNLCHFTDKCYEPGVMTNSLQLYQNKKAFNVYLLDAERLIRLCGFDRCDPSSNTRILHHMYTHLRIMAESVSLNANLNLESSGEDGNQSVANSRAFRIAENSLNTGLDGALEKPLELGLKDIHLESQGRWNQTMYPVIYGIPESLMTIFSQTVFLANEKNWLESLGRYNPQISVALAHHIKTLENSIWSWSLSNEISTMGPVRPPTLEPESLHDLLDHQFTQLMTLAIHQALIIYFYRRIHNVNAMLLQDTVRRTLDHLEPCMEDMINDLDFAPSLAWPVFIVACEAVSLDLREKALQFLDTIDDRGIFFTPKPAKDIVLTIWEKREQTGDLTIDWSYIMTDAIS